MNLKERAKKLKTDIPAVYLALKNVNTPFIAKFFAFLTVAYALSPIDLIPDFIPLLGYLDDLIILPALVALALRFIPDGIMLESTEKARDMWQDGKPKKWYYAIPVAVIWLLFAAVLIKLIFGL